MEYNLNKNDMVSTVLPSTPCKAYKFIDFSHDKAQYWETSVKTLEKIIPKDHYDHHVVLINHNSLEIICDAIGSICAEVLKSIEDKTGNVQGIVSFNYLPNFNLLGK